MQEIKMMSLEDPQESEAGNNLDKFSFQKFETKIESWVGHGSGLGKE